MEKLNLKKSNLKLLIFLSLIFFSTIISKSFIIVNVTSKSMEPTISSGDKIISLSKNLTTINQDDIILIKNEHPSIEMSYIVKRVVAKENDSVIIKNNKLFVNNTYIKDIGDRNAPYLNIKLKNKEFFVMGDYVNNSFDSRNFGPISYDNIIGKIIYIQK